MWPLFVIACTGPATPPDGTGPGDDTGSADSGSHDTGTPSPYTGGWPFNPDKAALGDPGVGSRVVKGGQVGNFTAVDQHGDEVQLYDFAGHGKPVILDVSAEWCLPCRDLARWIEGLGPETFESPPDSTFLDGIRAGDHDELVAAVEQQDAYWITIIAQDFQGAPGSSAAAQRWTADFPNARVPVMADPTGAMMFHLDVTLFPSVYVLDDQMMLVEVPSPSSIDEPLTAARGLLPTGP